MKKHLRIFLAYLCALLCCALLAGCTLTRPGAQPQSSTAPAAQQSSLVAFSSLAQNISEAGYYNILYTGDAEHTIYLLSLYDFSEMQHRVLCEKEGCTHKATSHKEVKRILVGTGVSSHAGSDSFKDSLPIFKGMRICPT